MDQQKFFGLRVLPLVALLVLAGGSRACGGDEFSTAGAGGSTPGPPGATCQSPDDCDDGDPCTIDACGVDGACATSPKCASGLQCCNGTCGECCNDTECDDGVGCTSDACVAGFCSSAPGACGPSEYCSIPRGGCVSVESCDAGQGCDDGDACTEDSCDGAFCVHSFCPSGSKCCDGRPDLGCNACCANSECDDGDLCTEDLCTSEGCVHPPKECPATTTCCAATGQCAECCSVAECDDAVDCTLDACVGGLCRYSPDHEACEPGQLCIGGADGGCQAAAECVTAEDCSGSGPCEVFECRDGNCISSPVACPDGTRCCPDAPEGTDPCRACCANAECDGPTCAQVTCVEGTCAAEPDDLLCAGASGVGRGQRCHPELGCIECETASDCGTHPCFAFECKNNECSALAPRECTSAENVLCQDCCDDADCPPMDDGVAQKCCLGRCCDGACDMTDGACLVAAVDG